MQAQRVSRSIFILVLNLGDKMGWVLNATPWLLCSRIKTRARVARNNVLKFCYLARYETQRDGLDNIKKKR
jgi:hypothetical protein